MYFKLEVNHKLSFPHHQLKFMYRDGLPPVDRSNSAQRIKSLADTINVQQNQQRMDAEAIMRMTQNRIETMQQRIDKQKQTDNQKFCLLTDQLSKLFAAQAAEKSSRDLVNQRKSKEIELIETSLQQQCEQEKQLRLELSARLKQYGIDKTKIMVSDIDKSRNERSSINEKLFNFMKQSITDVILTIQNDRKATDDLVTGVSQQLDQQCAEIRAAILKECQDSEQQQQNFQATFAKVCQMLQQKLSIERSEREQKEEGLLNLMEQLCIKVEEGM